MDVFTLGKLKVNLEFGLGQNWILLVFLVQIVSKLVVNQFSSKRFRALKYYSTVLCVKLCNNNWYSKLNDIISILHDSNYLFITTLYYGPLPTYNFVSSRILFYRDIKYLVPAEIISYLPSRKRNSNDTFKPFILKTILKRHCYTLTTLTVCTSRYVNVCRHLVIFLIFAQVLRNY